MDDHDHHSSQSSPDEVEFADTGKDGPSFDSELPDTKVGRQRELSGLSAETLLTAERAGIFEVRLRQSQILRVAGNDAFNQGNFKDAIQFYERALYHADFEGAKLSFEYTEDHRLQIFNTVYPVHLNLARCAIQEGRYREAITYCKKCFDIVEIKFIPDAVCGKIYFLTGKSQMRLGDYEAAQTELRRCLEFCPQDKAVAGLIRECRQKKSAEEKSSKECWKAALTKSSETGLYLDKVETASVAHPRGLISYVMDNSVVVGSTAMVLLCWMVLFVLTRKDSDSKPLS
jgi:tetratricopeptide (TPR) repeat protein